MRVGRKQSCSRAPALPTQSGGHDGAPSAGSRNRPGVAFSHRALRVVCWSQRQDHPGEHSVAQLGLGLKDQEKGRVDQKRSALARLPDAADSAAGESRHFRNLCSLKSGISFRERGSADRCHIKKKRKRRNGQTRPGMIEATLGKEATGGGCQTFLRPARAQHSPFEGQSSWLLPPNIRSWEASLAA